MPTGLAVEMVMRDNRGLYVETTAPSGMTGPALELHVNICIALKRIVWRVLILRLTVFSGWRWGKNGCRANRIDARVLT